ncbi:MAG: CHRD domain-containing protein [Cyanobacteria bacterium REEB65]|nr:CHRD domain-containing protein [Cyanobacteria bacterium REEB65]
MLRMAALATMGLLVAQANSVHLSATLTGRAETQPGALSAAGSADITLDPSSGQVCYDLSTTNLSGITAAHIHQGAPGQAGPIVVPLPITATSLKGCTSASLQTVRAITGQPQNYYVNIHTTRYPAGALRGQLGTAS